MSSLVRKDSMGKSSSATIRSPSRSVKSISRSRSSTKSETSTCNDNGCSVNRSNVGNIFDSNGIHENQSNNIGDVIGEVYSGTRDDREEHLGVVDLGGQEGEGCYVDGGENIEVDREEGSRLDVGGNAGVNLGGYNGVDLEGDNGVDVGGDNGGVEQPKTAATGSNGATFGDNSAAVGYKNEVNRRLEEEFDFEATLTAYRDEGKATLKIDPSQFSFDRFYNLIYLMIMNN